MTCQTCNDTGKIEKEWSQQPGTYITVCPRCNGDPKAPYGRNANGSLNRPNERIEITIVGNAKMAQAWADHINNIAPVLDALPVPLVSWRNG